MLQDIHNTTQKTTDRATRTGVSSSYSTRDNVLHRKLQIEQHEPVLAVLTPLVTPVVLLLNTIQKTTDRATRTGVSSTYSTRDKTLHRKLDGATRTVLAVLTPQ